MRRFVPMWDNERGGVISCRGWFQGTPGRWGAVSSTPSWPCPVISAPSSALSSSASRTALRSCCYRERCCWQEACRHKPARQAPKREGRAEGKLSLFSQALHERDCTTRYWQPERKFVLCPGHWVLFQSQPRPEGRAITLRRAGRDSQSTARSGNHPARGEVQLACHIAREAKSSPYHMSLSRLTYVTAFLFDLRYK